MKFEIHYTLNNLSRAGRPSVAMSQMRVIEPILFASTLTTVVYKMTIEEFAELFRVSECRAWFQQDNARTHVAKDFMNFVYEFFGD